MIERSRVDTPPPHRPSHARVGASGKIKRFVASERFVHWALAIPFVVLYVSAAVMLAFWAEPQPRYVRTAAALVHKAAGIALIVFPPLVLLRGWREWRAHLGNIKEVWTWTLNDVRWLLLSPLAAVNSRIELPEQGRFNAAEKLNFMMVCTTYPLYIATGLMIWAPGAAFVPWIVHLAMAALGLVLVAGHIFMASVNPSTRVGLEGMITGWVDREWAKHHYRRWYREQFERKSPPRSPAPARVSMPTRPPVARRAPAAAATPAPAPPTPFAPPRAAAPPSLGALLKQPARIRCGACGEVHGFESWERLLQRLFQVEPLFCPKCRTQVVPALGEAAPDLAHVVLQHLRHESADEPLVTRASVA